MNPFLLETKVALHQFSYHMLGIHTPDPTFILDRRSWSHLSLSGSSDSPNERVYNVEAAHSDQKDRILSDEAYPEERSHGQSLDELKARFDIGNLHYQPYSLRWWRQWCNRNAQALHMKAKFDIGNLHSAKTHVWQVVQLVIYHTIFITRYLSHDIGRQGAFWRTKAANAFSIAELIWLSFGNGSE